MKRRVVVALTGASGQIYGIRALQVMRAMPHVETHLVLTHSARVTIAQETDWEVATVQAMADELYGPEEVGAAIASGSFSTAAMIVAPCSVKTLSGIAHSYASDLVVRAADVHLKEGRPLLLMVRETPLHLGHLELMVQAARIGCIIFPPVPAFYARPTTVDDLINATVGRMLARVGLDNTLYRPWSGLASAMAPGAADEG
jgi:flavin prenyltransferase